MRDEVQGNIVWRRSGKANVFREELETGKLIPVALKGDASRNWRCAKLNPASRLAAS